MAKSTRNSKPTGTYLSGSTTQATADQSLILRSQAQALGSAYTLYYPPASQQPTASTNYSSDQIIAQPSSNPLSLSTIISSLSTWEQHMLFVGGYYAGMTFTLLSQALNVRSTHLESIYHMTTQQKASTNSIPEYWIVKNRDGSSLAVEMYKELIDDIFASSCLRETPLFRTDRKNTVTLGQRVRVSEKHCTSNSRNRLFDVSMKKGIDCKIYSALERSERSSVRNTLYFSRIFRGCIMVSTSPMFTTHSADTPLR